MVTDNLKIKGYEKKKTQQERISAMQVLRSGQHLRVYGGDLHQRQFQHIPRTIQRVVQGRTEGLCGLPAERGRANLLARDTETNNLKDNDMRTITKTYNIFLLAELSTAARETAYSEWLSTFEYPWSSDNRNTLDAFERIFNIKVTDWSYDTCKYSYRFTSQYSAEEEELSGIRLLKYLVNNYWHTLFKPRTYYLKGNFKKQRKSRVLTDSSCVLTGYCADEDILKPIYHFLNSPDTDTTLYDLMDKCLDSFFKSCRDDMEYQCSEECFEESCEANKYEFLENGKMYN